MLSDFSGEVLERSGAATITCHGRAMVQASGAFLRTEVLCAVVSYTLCLAMRAVLPALALVSVCRGFLV